MWPDRPVILSWIGPKSCPQASSRSPGPLLPDVRQRLAGRYRRHVHPALRATIRRARFSRPEQQRQLVSVIIPIYNVEDYLAECLDSVVEQDYRNLEIIVVDDGSPDGSHEIAASYARWDPRIRIIRQPNAGLGAARNTGIREVHGKFLTFVDSDDTLPLDAISLMVTSITRTKSDFVVGAPVRMNADRTWTSGWVKDVHAVDRDRVRLDDFPEVLKNVFAWNKLFTATFFRRVVGGFPEGIRYEDQEPTAKAYVAGTFDVLSAPVYFWRDREDGTSITQQKTDPADLHDRLLVKKAVSDVISGASTSTHEVWLAKAIGFDLRPYFEQLPRTNGDFFEQLRAGAVALEGRMTPKIWQLVPLVDRLPALALLAGERADVELAVTRRHEYGWFLPAEVRADGIYLNRSALSELRVDPPDELLRLGPADLRVVTKATSLWWHDAVLRLEGYAYLTNLPYDPATMQTSLELVSGNGIRVPLQVRSRPDPRIDIETKDAWNSHQHAGFAVDIDPTELPIGATDPWHIEATISTPGGSYGSARLLSNDVRGIGGTRSVAPARGIVRWIAGFEEDSGFELRHTTAMGAPVGLLRGDGRGIQLTVEDPTAKVLCLSSRSLRRNVEITGKRIKNADKVAFSVTVPELLGSDDLAVEHLWSMQVRGADGQLRRLTYLGSTDDLNADCPESSQLRATMTRAGTLRLAQNRWWAVADEVLVDGDQIRISGRISAPGAEGLKARMVSKVQSIEGTEGVLSGDTFSVCLPFDRDNQAPTTRHGFSVRLSVVLDGRRQERWLKVADGLQHSFPQESDGRWHGLTITRTRKAAALWVRFRPLYCEQERGRLAQRRLHEHFRTPESAGGGVREELMSAVLFESFNGRSISDSVLALYSELTSRGTDLDLYWAVADLGTPTPEGSTPLLLHSKAYMDVLHNARYVINNSNFPFYYRKRDGQTYIQTWHGTPLKKIGRDIPATNLSLSYRQLMEREAGYWDVLLAQNKFAAAVLPKAFGYHGDVLQVGYPRNDALVNSGAQLRRKRARRALNLADDQLAVLYAPTWRDDVSASSGYAMVSYLDYEGVRTTLGKQGTPTAILLRGHANTIHHAADAPETVIDVTHHPDINDLILASDLLITDYSSVMFDYCVTGKPILFLTPDLDRYRDVTRGFYLNFEQIAPGPLCRTDQELIAALERLDRTRIDYADRYATFRSTYAGQDDGSAAARVVDLLLKPSPLDR